MVQMKSPSITALILSILITAGVCGVIGDQVGLYKGKIIGYDRANSQNQRMAFTRAKALAEAEYRGEINQCKEWVDGLGADLSKANSIIRGYQG